MSDADGTFLRGLPGDNPLGFLAALGVQVALAVQGLDHKLHWTDDPIPHPVVSPARDLEEIARAVRAVAQDWLDGPVFTSDLDQTLKVDASDARDYLRQARNAGKQGTLALCLLAENGRYKSGNSIGKSQPTDFYFTAARQQFLAMARTRLRTTSVENILSDMSDLWQYKCNDSNSLMWDLQADRHHAYSAADPNDHKANPKSTNAGAESLAILGLSCFPCHSHDGNTRTRGFQRVSRLKYFSWPLWTVPITPQVVSSLLSHVSAPTLDIEGPETMYAAWGIMRVMQSQIRSRGQGFGTFGPPRVVWQRE